MRECQKEMKILNVLNQNRNPVDFGDLLFRSLSGLVGAVLCMVGMTLAFLPDAHGMMGFAVFKSAIGVALFWAGLMMASAGAKTGTHTVS